MVVSRSCTSVATLGASHMAESGTDQHESRVTVRETAHHSGTVADFSIEPFNDIVAADAGPVFAGKVAVSQSFLNTILNFFSSLQHLEAFIANDQLYTIHTTTAQPLEEADPTGLIKEFNRIWCTNPEIILNRIAKSRSILSKRPFAIRFEGSLYIAEGMHTTELISTV